MEIAINRKDYMLYLENGRKVKVAVIPAFDSLDNTIAVIQQRYDSKVRSWCEIFEDEIL